VFEGDDASLPSASCGACVVSTGDFGLIVLAVGALTLIVACVLPRRFGGAR